MGAGAASGSLVCTYVAQRTGSNLSKHQLERLTGVLTRRMGGKDELVYLEHLKSAHGAAELAELMSVISVHKTDLFRDEVQLEAFSRFVLAPMVRNATRPLRIWSAGCATGEEVATLLILLAEAGAPPGSTVLGTDISAAALESAKALSFHPSVVRRVPRWLRARYFRDRGGQIALTDELRAQARFQQHNLADFPYPLPPSGQGFDVIFCRNVLIYFTEMAFDRTVQGLAERLALKGTLVLSAAEPILRVHPGLTTLHCDQAFFYARKEPEAAPRPVVPLRRPADPTPAPGVLTRPVVQKAEAPPSNPGPYASSGPGPLRRTLTGEFQALSDPRQEALSIFQLVLDWAAVGESDADTEQGLRRCLYLDPHFAQARYLLGMLLEQRGARADAASEYRRALAALVEGRSRATAFFLNDERLKTACTVALRRLGFGT